MQNQLEHAGYSIDIPEEYKGLNYFNVLPTDEERRNKLRELGSFFPREAVIDFTITGSKDDCIKKIERFIEKGVKHFIFFHYFSPDFKEAQRIYSEEIIPYFKD
jgi:alkanesulfonate monooxygenase SsuD/methylene tetrahydromethanopterin reductase-like flavin-dependent oxidoreductase (luciferase family)